MKRQRIQGNTGVFCKDIWCYIATFVNHPPTLEALTSTCKVLREYRKRFYLQLLERHGIDYNEESELYNNIDVNVPTIRLYIISLYDTKIFFTYKKISFKLLGIPVDIEHPPLCWGDVYDKIRVNISQEKN